MDPMLTIEVQQMEIRYFQIAAIIHNQLFHLLSLTANNKSGCTEYLNA